MQRLYHVTDFAQAARGEVVVVVVVGTRRIVRSRVTDCAGA